MFKIHVKDGEISINFNTSIVALSSTLDGGLRKVRTVVFRDVPKDCDHTCIERILREVHEKYGDSTVTFLTAAEIPNDCVICVDDNLLCVVSAGFTNLFTVVNGNVRTALEGYSLLSTVNIFVFLNEELSIQDLVDLLNCVFIGKVSALVDHDVLICGGYGYGTTSDAYCVACQRACERFHFSGPYTERGRKVIYTVYRCVSKLLEKWGLGKDRDVLTRLSLFLNDRELLEKIEDAAIRLVPEEFPNKDKVRTLFRKYFTKILRSDPNVQLLLRAGIELERLGQTGSLPTREANMYYSQDSVAFVVDEVLGLALALTLGGVYGLFEYYRYDKHKPGILRRLPPVLDDLIAALIGGIMSRIWTDLNAGLVSDS